MRTTIPVASSPSSVSNASGSNSPSGIGWSRVIVWPSLVVTVKSRPAASSGDEKVMLNASHRNPLAPPSPS